MIKSCIIAITLVVSATWPAWAKPIEAELFIDTPINVTEITVTMNEELVGRRTSSWAARHRGEFMVHPVEAERLAAKLHDDLTKAFAQTAHTDSADITPATLAVTITQIKPTNPGFTRNGSAAGISPHGSVALGGATIEAQLVGPDDRVLGTLSYHAYDRFLDETLAQGPWSRARRTFRTFANRAADAVNAVAH